MDAEKLFGNASNDQLVKLIESVTPFIVCMKEMNAEMMKVIPEIAGKEHFGIIIVCGEEGVKKMRAICDFADQLDEIAA